MVYLLLTTSYKGKMKIGTVRLSSERLYIFTFFYYITVQILGATQFCLIPGWKTVKIVTNYITFALLLMVFLKKRINVYWFFISSCLLTIGIISSMFNDHQFQTGILILFIINGDSINNYRILSTYVKWVAILVGITILLSFTGIYYSDYRISNLGQKRQYLGFMSATHSSNYFFHLVLAYVGNKKNKITIKETIIITALNIFFQQATHTRAVFYYTFGVLVFLWIHRFFPRIFENKVASGLIPMIMPISAVFSVSLSFFYSPDNPIMYQLNILLSSRLRLAKKALDMYGLPLFGSDIKWETGRYGIERFTDYLYVDAAFVNIALTYGIILLIIVIIGFSLMMRMSIKQNDFYLTIALMFLSIHSFSDPQLLELRYNPYILFLFSSFMYFAPRRKRGMSIEARKTQFNT